MEDDTQTPDRAGHAAEPQAFLSLAADYRIAAESESTSLMDDAALFLECACESVSALAAGLEDETSPMRTNPKSAAVMLCGVRRFIEMAMSNVGMVNRRLIALKRNDLDEDG